MSLTLEELKERMAERMDEQYILEILTIDSYQLVDAFSDIIEDMYEKIAPQMEDDYFD
jgi:hypothetical protein